MTSHPATFAQAVNAFSAVMSAHVVTSRDAAPSDLAGVAQLIGNVQKQDAQVFLIGNGGSAAVCSHIQNDLVNKLRMRAHVLHEPSVLTCMSNDYGYATAFGNMVARMGRPRDLLIAISSSGKSANMLAAVSAAREQQMAVLTLTGFDMANPLRSLGDANIWLPSVDYGEVEIGHLFILHGLVDVLRQAA